MIVRKAQIESIEGQAREQFVQFMQNHLNEHFPDHCKALGRQGVSEAIESGIARAEEHSMISERDVCKFIDLQFSFGQSFDSEHWARGVFSDPEIRNASTRIDALMDRAEAYLDSLRGRDTNS